MGGASAIVDEPGRGRASLLDGAAVAATAVAASEVEVPLDVVVVVLDVDASDSMASHTLTSLSFTRLSPMGFDFVAGLGAS